MDRIEFKQQNGTYATARVVDALPQAEEIDFHSGVDQIIKCDRLIGANENKSADDGYYDFYEVTEFWGSQCSDPAEFDDNHEVYYIAVWNEYDDEE